MTSALEIITGAAKLIGVVFKSETLDADEANDGLAALNDMLESWSNEDLITYAMSTESFSLTGASSYTIGTGGDFNTSRPIDINNALVRISNIDYTLEIIPQEVYQQIPFKSISTQIPGYLTYDNGYPLGTIKMYPIPLSGGTLVMQMNKVLTAIATLVTSVDFPPGWKRALRYNLAIELAGEYGVQVPQQVADIARKSLGNLKRATSVNRPLPMLANNPVQNNIFSGWYV